jgi:hypothetical protein
MTDYPTLKTFLAALGPERDCRWLLSRIRWPDGDRCPRCGDQQVTLVSSGISAKARDRLLYRCWACDYHFSATPQAIADRGTRLPGDLHPRVQLSRP